MAKPPSRRSSSTEIGEFLQKSRSISKFVSRQPRLLFAIDATASRQPTWDTASHLQRDMFTATAKVASLSIQLCYYRGFHEFFASRWLTDAEQLGSLMGRVHCEGGHTQIQRVLKHALSEHQKMPLRAVVFIGDAIEESADNLCELAGQCGLRQLPLFLFQEGSTGNVEHTLRSMAKISGGAYARFDLRSANTLAALLAAVASFVAGGRQALEASDTEGAKLLLQQLHS